MQTVVGVNHRSIVSSEMLLNLLMAIVQRRLTITLPARAHPLSLLITSLRSLLVATSAMCADLMAITSAMMVLSLKSIQQRSWTQLLAVL